MKAVMAAFILGLERFRSLYLLILSGVGFSKNTSPFSCRVSRFCSTAGQLLLRGPPYTMVMSDDVTSEIRDKGGEQTDSPWRRETAVSDVREAREAYIRKSFRDIVCRWVVDPEEDTTLSSVLVFL